MWEQTMQVEALRLLSDWWDSSHRSRRPPWGRRRKLTTRGATAADVLVLPSGYVSAHLDERLAEGS
jgi:hypothetical protein